MITAAQKERAQELQTLYISRFLEPSTSLRLIIRGIGIYSEVNTKRSAGKVLSMFGNLLQ